MDEGPGTMPRVCSLDSCRKELVRGITETKLNWRNRKYCNRECSALHRHERRHEEERRQAETVKRTNIDRRRQEVTSEGDLQKVFEEWMRRAYK